MSRIQTSDPRNPLAFMPVGGKPQQLFVLLHGESSHPRQLQPLAEAFKQAFPLALIVLPYGTVQEDASTYSWLYPLDITGQDEAAGVARALPALTAQIRAMQAEYGLSPEQTALAGFSQGATLALEACLTQGALAGRVLAFSGSYAGDLQTAPPATTLHFLHGAQDPLVSLARIQKVHARLAQLQGDATLDVASDIGHELHPALIQQAVHRLKTCVPLRRWEEAMGDLQAQSDQAAAGPDGKTLH